MNKGVSLFYSVYKSSSVFFDLVRQKLKSKRSGGKGRDGSFEGKRVIGMLKLSKKPGLLLP